MNITYPEEEIKKIIDEEVKSYINSILLGYQSPFEQSSSGYDFRFKMVIAEVTTEYIRKFLAAELKKIVMKTVQDFMKEDLAEALTGHLENVLNSYQESKYED